MDRISALRTVEEALARYEDGELELPELEREVRGTLRTYASTLEDGQLYRARGDTPVDGLVVVAESRTRAREQVTAHLDTTEPVEFDLERVETR